MDPTDVVLPSMPIVKGAGLQPLQGRGREGMQAAEPMSPQKGRLPEKGTEEARVTGKRLGVGVRQTWRQAGQ